MAKTTGEHDRWQPYRDAGFQVVDSCGTVKLVRGLCELHVLTPSDPDARASSLSFGIPVVKVDHQSGIPGRLVLYLEDRNKRHGGPGAFEIEGDTVWYKTTVTQTETPEQTALRAQGVVEKIGPRILNLLR